MVWLKEVRYTSASDSGWFLMILQLSTSKTTTKTISRSFQMSFGDQQSLFREKIVLQNCSLLPLIDNFDQKMSIGQGAIMRNDYQAIITCNERWWWWWWFDSITKIICPCVISQLHFYTGSCHDSIHPKYWWNQRICWKMWLGIMQRFWNIFKCSILQDSWSGRGFV